MATYSTNKKLIKICKKPTGHYIGAGFVGRDIKSINDKKQLADEKIKELELLLH